MAPTFRLAIAAAAAFLGFAACDSARGTPTGTVSTGSPDFGGTITGVDPTGNQTGCSDQAKLVYLVDSDTNFYSFKPDTGVFSKVGLLNCPASFGAAPFSMGVDRSPTAWVLYDSGELFQVSVTDASCKATTFATGQEGYNQFGMGFSSNSAGSTDETLFIAGGDTGLGIDTSAPSMFGSVAFPSLLVSQVGSVSGWPELTGTGDGQLWGFFPSDSSTPKVSEIDKTTGKSGTTYTLASAEGTPEAWAFAFWGGDYWVFLKRDTDDSTNVYRVKGADGSVTTAYPNTGKKIVGAGVSTCAPTTIM